ncbi:DUF2812 domain-containing protein [Anaeromicropila herbilytica]|uniref:DUF2812 domain-containing protein n=1 Tax=Anaeromicropila herbilytica TaxID=2785025 RepID=A0A7R7EQJ9_9FIRM|nr:DUF2812 domain-containing protein [Anaeromicropila herbilytica]BCN32702.1 hypothetical protein bsdtb5_39970 [Anaeromicropila herbilytica]
MKNRIMNNRKYVRKTFLVHQYEEEEIFLSDMRAQGWKFIALYSGVPTMYEFEQCEPEEYIYQLDYVETKNDTEDYHQLYQDSGWEEVVPWNALGGKWYYFCKKSDNNDEKIYTDPESKIGLFNMLWKKYTVFLAICSFFEINGIIACFHMIARDASFLKIVAGVGIVAFTSAIIFFAYNMIAISLKKAQLEKAKKERW